MRRLALQLKVNNMEKDALHFKTGDPADRVDGKAKVTGAARYAAEYKPENLVSQARHYLFSFSYLIVPAFYDHIYRRKRLPLRKQ